MGSSKRFPATAKKLRKAREDGDVAKSAEVTACCAMLGGVLGLWAASRRVTLLISSCCQTLGLMRDLASYDMIRYVLELATLFSVVLIIVLCCCFLAVLAGEVFQVGIIVSAKPLAPDFSRLNVLRGLQKLFGVNPQTGVWNGFDRLLEIGKKIVAAIAVSVIVVIVVSAMLSRLAVHGNYAPEDLQALLLIFTARAVCSILVFVIGLATIDLFIARSRRSQRLKMDDEELRREFRESEGDPETKALRKQMFRQLVFQGMVSGIRSARVLVVGHRENIKKITAPKA